MMLSESAEVLDFFLKMWRGFVLSEKTKHVIEEQYPAIMDAEDVMKLLRISRRTLYRLMEEGMLSGWKDEDSVWSFARSDIIEFLEKNYTI